MRPTPVLVATALLTAACSSSVVGDAGPVLASSAGPLTEVLATVEADAGVEGQVRIADVAATADGRFIVLLTGDLGPNHRGVLVELVPGDGGLSVGAVTEGPAFADLGEVHVADDGTVVALAPVLPEAGDAGSGDGGREQDLALAVLEPGADEILGQVLPLYVRNSVYRALVETTAGFYGAQRTAMKNATDNAGDMLEALTRTYNRVRQAAITQEIAEIVGGAAALE